MENTFATRNKEMNQNKNFLKGVTMEINVHG